MARGGPPLCLHLDHGIWSWLHSRLKRRLKRFFLKIFSHVIAIVVRVGFGLVPVGSDRSVALKRRPKCGARIASGLWSQPAAAQPECGGRRQPALGFQAQYDLVDDRRESG